MTEQNLEQKLDFNPLDLAGLAIQAAGGRYSTERNNPNYVAAAINDFEKSMTDSEKIKYGDHLINLKVAQAQAIQTIEKGGGKYHLNDLLINHFNRMEQGYSLTLKNSKVKDLNEALTILGYNGEKLAVDENLAIKDLILDKEALEKASDKDKAISASVNYLQSALIELAGSKLLNDSVDLMIKQYNGALKPKEKKKETEEIEYREAA